MNTKVKNNKILKFCIFSIVFLIALLFVNVDEAYAATATVNNITWTYTVNNGKATNVYATSPSTINASYLTDGTLVVPDILGGYEVISVGSNVVNYNIVGKGSSTNNSYIKKIQLPSTVTTINNYAFRRLTALTAIEGMENVTQIGTYAFQNSTSLTSFEIPSKVTSIGNYTFNGCTKLNTIKNLDNITTIGDSAFYGCTGFTSLTLPINLQTIGSSAFYGCTGLTSLTLPTNLQTIGSSAFFNCSKIKGDLIIPENVTSIGASAFYGCTGLDGNIEFRTTKLVSIGNSTFYNCTKVKKAILPGTLESVGSQAFEGFKDIYVDTEEDNSNISFASNFSGSNTAYVHYLNDEHTVEAEVLPGVKITDLNTGTDFEFGSFKDGTEINLQLSVEPGYDYKNLTYIIEKDAEYKNTGKTYQVLSNTNYMDANLLRNTKILALDISNGLDLVARTYIDTKNGSALDIERQPIYALENAKIAYKHTKYPVIVEKGDVLVYKIRIYNEGNKAGTANKIVEYLPDGLEYISDSKINNQYDWKVSEDGRTITTEYTKNHTLSAYTGISAPSFVELAIECRVTKEKQQDKTLRLTNFVEIAEASEEDVDSIPGNIVIEDSENYKKEEAENSDSASFIQGEEDDQDFENVVILRSVPVSYVLKISKVDSKDFQLLNGAKFDLLNENGEVLQSGVTVENGELIFDKITTYDEGIDVYYISEVETPVGYTNPLEQTIKISVVKTITDVMTESYSLEIICDLLETRIDTKIDENALVPIYTKEQLMKIGSKEEISIKGNKYILGTDNSYRLMEDIDISGAEWEPLPNITGIFDGNNKKITGLTITDKNKKDIGLFESFSGVIENLTLDNVSINIDLSSEIEEIRQTYKNNKEELEKQLDALVSPYHIGGLVGRMTGGAVLNTTVNGNIETDANNVGGFVGYGENGYLIKIKNSTNNANVSTTNSNAGGFVGYTYSALTLVNCENNGKINASSYNAGGLVGYSEAKDYETNIVKAEFDSQSAIVSLIIGNDKYIGSYSLKLNKIDGQSKKLIDGTEFTVLDENKKVINGLEKVKVKNGVLDIGTFEITSTGIDTYFIKENTAVEGYDLINDFIKVNVIKTWDGVNSKFKVSVDSSNIGMDEFISVEYTPDDKLASLTGTNREFNQIDTVKWLVNKVVATDCKNNGEITAGGNASGIFAKTNCGVNIENCTNNAKITSQNHTAGLLSEALRVDKDTNITINNSSNKGEIILEMGSLNPQYPNASGILANTTAYTIIKNTDNEAEVSAENGNNPTMAGIVANTEENIIINKCNNKGKITAIGGSYATDIASGILGKSVYPDTTIDITNCVNTGEINAIYSSAGVLGLGAGDKIRISDTQSNNCSINSIQNAGGIVAVSATDIYITNCSVENINLESQGGRVGGILAIQCDMDSLSIDSKRYRSAASMVDIENCKVNKMIVSGSPIDKGGIAGAIMENNYGSWIEQIKFSDCTIENSKIELTSMGGTTGMLCSRIKGDKNILVERCNVKNSIVNCGFDSTNSSGQMDAGMFIGFIENSTNIDEGFINITDSNIENCDMKIGGVGNHGNILAFSSGNKTNIKITRSNIKSSPIQTKGTGSQRTGNIVGCVMSSKEVIVDNCEITDSPVTTETTAYSSLVSAGIGMCWTDRAEFKNLNITNSNAISYGAALSIVCGDFYYSTSSIDKEIIIEDCNITNCSLDSENKENTSSYNTGATNVGILMGQNRLGTAKIKNVTVTSTTEEPDVVYADGSGGLCIGYTEKITEIDNLNISNYKLKSRNTGSYIGGIIGKVGNSGNLSVKNSNISNLDFETFAATGGVAGYLAGTFEMDNTTVKYINIDSKNQNDECISGVVARIGTTMKITNSNINNIEISSKVGRGFLAGVVSLAVGYNGENEFSNNKVSNIKITNNDYENTGYSSGVIGIVSTRLIFTNNEVSDIKIVGKSKCISAVLCQGRIDTIGDNENDKNTLKDVVLNSDSSQQVAIGGLVAISNDSRSIIKNITVDNIDITSNSTTTWLGGIVANGSCNLSNCIVKNSNIESKTTDYRDSYNQPFVGGIFGLDTNSGYNHLNLTVQNTNIKTITGYVGGIYGVAKSNISNAKLINSNVIGGSENCTVGGILGVDGYNITISNSSVTDSKISNVSQAIPAKTPSNTTIYPTGGIAGFAKGLVQNCDVISTTVKSTGATAYATGGIVGHGNNVSPTLHTVITKCNVIDSIISGYDGVGGIAGVAVPEFNECSVKGTETRTTSLDLEDEAQIINIDDISVKNDEIGVLENKDQINETPKAEDSVEVVEQVEVPKAEALVEVAEQVEVPKAEALVEVAEQVEAPKPEAPVEVAEQIEALKTEAPVEVAEQVEAPEAEELVETLELEEVPETEEPVETSESEEVPETEEPVEASEPEEAPETKEPVEASEPEETPETEEPVEVLEPEEAPKAEASVEVAEPEENITDSDVENFIRNDSLLNATTSTNESITPNTYVMTLLINEEEDKSKVSGTNYVGGILGYGGTVLDTYATTTTINKCTVTDTKIEGKTDVHEDIGRSAEYPTGYTSIQGIEIINNIIEFIKENVLVEEIE